MEKIDGVVDIITDVETLTCTFKVTKPDADYVAKLAEFAETNDKLTDYSIE